MATRVTQVAFEVLNSGSSPNTKTRMTQVAFEMLASTTLVQPGIPPYVVIIIQ